MFISVFGSSHRHLNFSIIIKQSAEDSTLWWVSIAVTFKLILLAYCLIQELRILSVICVSLGRMRFILGRLRVNSE